MLLRRVGWVAALHLFFVSPCTYAASNSGARPDEAPKHLAIPTLSRPLSLVWDPKLEVAEAFIRDLPKREIHFPLNPLLPEQRIVWRASEQIPLLVLMPERGDEIDSGARLIGEWSYGGKDDGRGDKLPWESGFDVLESLDMNRDGALRGAELNALGLWFDGNQDGKSSGELKRLSALGVTALFYREHERRNLKLERGYERVKTGNQVETGAIVAIDVFKADAVNLDNPIRE